MDGNPIQYLGSRDWIVLDSRFPALTPACRQAGQAGAGMTTKYISQYSNNRVYIMSGHSKWSSLKHQKGVADARRAGVFTKLANSISVAARAGGDPSMNFQLRLAIDRARAANMPKSNIDKAIARGSGSAGAGAGAIEEILYEAYGPGGAAILIEVATDNKNRAIAEIKAALNKFGGKLAGAGAVQYQFEKKGQLIASPPPNKSADETEMKVIEAGAEDYQKSDGDYIIYTKPNDIALVKDALSVQGFTVRDAQIVWEPNQSLAVDEETSNKIVRLLEMLDNLEDVSSVNSNAS